MKIEFITPEKGRGSDRAIAFKKLGLSAIPLRFVSLLLDDPITVMEDGVKILIPRPENYCLHKLIVASRRKAADKGLKDLQQAICVSVIVDEREVRALFGSLPKKWKQAIIRMLEKSKQGFPLLNKEIDALSLTLQNPEK